MHEKERGLILVNSYPDQEDILKNIQKLEPELIKRLTFKDRNSSTSNEELIRKHKRDDKENSVLLSPGMWYGVDLKDDYGRFCIIATAPYIPNDSFNQAKTRLYQNDMWKKRSQFFKLIQGAGRCCRHQEDHSTTYVIDEGCEVMYSDIVQYLKDHPNENKEWYNDSVREF